MEIKTTDSLHSKIYHDNLNLRRKVFVEEQHVPENLEIDEFEPISTYFTGYLENTPVVTARIFPTKDNGWHIQRVATKKEYRKKGLAKELLEYIENLAKSQSINYLILGAQDQAQEFYLKLGFKVSSEQYLDAGIAHHNMKKNI